VIQLINEELLAISQEEYQRQLHEFLTSRQKLKGTPLQELIKKILEDDDLFE